MIGTLQVSAVRPEEPSGIGATRRGGKPSGTPPALGVAQEAPVESVTVEELRTWQSPRAGGEDPEHIRMLAELATPLPPIVVHRPTMRVIDGAHRLRAAAVRGDERIEVRFFDGTEADAFVLAVELNSAHGLPLSLADRKAAAVRIIGSHPQWSDRRIASVVGLAANTVGSIRQRSTAQNEQPNTSVGRDGRVRPRSGAEGRRRAGSLMQANPAASLREIARAAGISLATASDVRTRLRRGEPLTTPQQHALEQDRPGALIAPRPQRPAVPTADLLDSLSNDPCLRLPEAGRILLRALRICAVDADVWARLVETVPPHRQESVVSLARECADAWQSFADRLTERMGARQSDTV
ncbi:ParB/RepB/Spo0J family partition protein [Kitasatospora sp. NPDC097643]|uniref:ParB/RepB/Spo0J family partition protein n=1 Tax=Kitasatospora sp. NPDC097643 TaxID=3157230 RepID=UPI00332B31AE